MQASPQHDTASAVSRLPTEVLIQIFLYNTLLLPVQRGSHYRLFNILFVCWRWYKITISTPSLWCRLGNDVNLWPLFARRSGDLDLFIYIYDITGDCIPVPEEFHKMIRDPIFHERIRTITLDSGDPFTPHPISNTTNNLPTRLTSLSFANACKSLASPTSLVKFTPSLEELEIRDLSVGFGVILGLHNLTHLSLSNSSPAPDDSGVILAVLRANPRLQHLRIDCWSDKLTSAGEYSPVPLPHLRFIDMSCLWGKSTLSRFFECLELSTNVEEIRLANVQPEFGENLAWVFTALHPAISPGRLQYLLVGQSAWGKSTFHYCKRTSDDSSLPQTVPFLILETKDILLSPFHDNLRHLEQHNILQDLSHLEVKIFQWEPHLQPVFEMTKTLETLSIWTWGKRLTLFDLLDPEAVGETGDTGEADFQTSPKVQSQPLLPTLRELNIIDANFHEYDTDASSRSQLETAIFSCLQARKHYGSFLERLKFIACQHVDPEWVGELTEVVREIYWDASEDGDSDGYESSEEYFPSQEETETSESEWTDISD